MSIKNLFSNTISIRNLFLKLSNEKKIFVFGAPHAGKSTVLASMIYQLGQSDSYIHRRDPLKNPEGVQVIKEMVEAFENKKFPEQTPRDNWREVKIEYEKPSENNSHTFIFYEIAGESVERFDPTHEQHDEIEEPLRDFLAISNGVIIVASASPDSQVERNSINDFLEFLYRTNYERPILFLLTKFDLVASDYANEVQAALPLYRNSIKLLSRDKKTKVLAFSIGTVADDNGIIDMTLDHYIPPILDWMEALT